jgi:hypothetical protein
MPVHFAANVFVDTAGDPDGQKMAFQVNARVGSPRLIADALIQRINDIGVDAAWQIDIHPITDVDTFWEAVGQHASETTSLQLIFAAPNVLGLMNNITKELGEARSENNAATVSITLENKDGIKVDTPPIRDAIKLIALGVGDAILRKGRRILFDTRRRTRSINIGEDAPAEQGMESTLTTIFHKLFGR